MGISISEILTIIGVIIAMAVIFRWVMVLGGYSRGKKESPPTSEPKPKDRSHLKS